MDEMKYSPRRLCETLQWANLRNTLALLGIVKADTASPGRRLYVQHILQVQRIDLSFTVKTNQHGLQAVAALNAHQAA